MNKYYYLTCALPTISLKAAPEMNFEELIFMLRVNLRKSDLKKVILFQRFIDITNLRLFWINKEIDPRGNLNIAEIEDVILIKDIFPDFVFDFLERYEKREDRLNNFSFLMASFFNDVIFKSRGFIKFYFQFEREMRLVMTALRSEKLKRDLLYELRFEDLRDDFMEYILAQKDMNNFEPPQEYMEVKKIYKKNINNPKKLHIALLEYKFNKINQFAEKKPFTIDQILSYMVLLMIVEDFDKLNAKEGKEKVEKL